MWQDFFATFREDEKNFEWKQFRQEAKGVQLALDDLGDQLPDAFLCRQIIFLLKRFISERNNNRDDRFQELHHQCSSLQADLESQKMTSSWMSDEMSRSRSMILQSLQGRDTYIHQNEERTLTELISKALGEHTPTQVPIATPGKRRRSTDGESGHYRIAAELMQSDSTQDSSELALVRSALTQLLNEGITVAKLRRILEDEALARSLVELVDTYRRQRSILKRVGLLHSSDSKDSSRLAVPNL